MADIRDLILTEQPRIGAAPAMNTAWARLKLTARRAIVATSVPPLRSLYAAIYRAHAWYAARTLGRAPGVRSVYVARGAASKDVVFGVSDIDLLVFGDWTDEQQAHLMATLRRLISRSPLYDHTAAAQVNTIESLRSLYDNDYFFQFRFDWARNQSKLIFGEDVLSTLPRVPPDKARGGFLMEMKLSWMMFTTSAFGSGPTATDTLFRNSIAFKNVAGILNMERALNTGEVEYSRSRVVERVLSSSEACDRAVLQRFSRCGKRRYLRYDGDVQNDAFHLMLRHIEKTNRSLGGKPPFDAIPGAQLHIDAPAGEVIKTAAAQSLAMKLAAHAKERWQGYKGAYLLPRNSFAGLDDLQLLLDVDPNRPPAVEQVRELCALHLPVELRQRLALYLLLPDGAYSLERRSPLEFWQALLAPAANPEVFTMLGDPEFVIDGQARPAAQLRWTRFAATQIEHELRLRRTAMAKAGALDAPLNPLHMLRGLWRQLQLEVVQRSMPTRIVQFPLTMPAVRRGIRAWGIPDVPLLDELQSAYEGELEGRPSRAAQLVPEAIALFTRFVA